MKLLFDQNLSYRLVEPITELFPESDHVRLIGLDQATDIEIWEHAKEHNFIIVSKDSDFHQRSFLYGHPPKIVWIQKGNCSTNDVLSLIKTHYREIYRFANSEDSSFLILN